MKIWDYIKEKFFKRKKMLPEPDKILYEEGSNNINSFNTNNSLLEVNAEQLKNYFHDDNNKEKVILENKSDNFRIHLKGEKSPNRENTLSNENLEIFNSRKENERQEKFNNNIKVKINVKPNTLDYAIEQYMAALITQRKLGLKVNPYNTLIQLGSIENKDSKNNGKNEAIFLDNVKKGKYNKKLLIHEQKGKSQKPIFYHIFTSGKNSRPANYRIYLNSKKENVALLAHEFAKKFGNQEYYFKFNSNYAKSRRSEQFVFYIEDEKELVKTASIIDSVKRENPKLFEGAENVNPYLKTFEGYIAYARNVQKGQYNDLNGRKKDIDKSYNSLLSNALEEAFLRTTKDIAVNDLNISGSNIYNYKTLAEIVDSKLLEIIYANPNLQMKFIEKTKNNLGLISKRNPELDIKGIKNITQDKVVKNIMQKE